VSPDAQAICPSTVGETAGAACTVEGLSCRPQYACGVTFGIARCVCTGGAFACTDVTDAALSGPQSVPACPQSKVTPQRCPATEALARGATCSELNFSCSYKAPCGGEPGLDVCTCSQANGPGYAFSCETPCHPNTGVYTIDSGAPQQDDAGAGTEDADAPYDAAPSVTDAANASG
jgi:hypothetical protein